jgi:tyrosyl-DNA phosphodiesterase-1
MQASRYSNVTLHKAFMPEAFGTHHTKMMVLLRHDDLAQIIIHTANLIRRDWANLSQAVWTSPLLPLRPSGAPPPLDNPPMGSGARFKIDFLNYLRAYNTKRTICQPLIEQLSKYDFSEIRGALVASVPGRHSVDSDVETKWGWQSLREVLSSVPVKRGETPEIVLQISSIATLGQTNLWLDKTLFKSLGTSKSAASPAPKYKIIFPTPDEIRRSLDGYQSGASIHTKIQTAAQLKQLQYLKPILHHWAGDGGQQHSSTSSSSANGRSFRGFAVGDVAKSTDSASHAREAGRRRAAPHIKTYIRFCDASKTQIDWALVTSANISKQAWGEACNALGEARICSYELGVLVWPELWDENAKMVPTFKQDMPIVEDPSAVDGKVSLMLLVICDHGVLYSLRCTMHVATPANSTAGTCWFQNAI